MLRPLLNTLVIVLLLLFSGQSLYGAEKMTVFVSIVPQKYFVQQIAGDLVDVKVMVPPGVNPATYEPKPSQMEDLLKAKLYFAIGVPFEDIWLEKIAAANPEMKIIHTDKRIEKSEEEGRVDYHIWLSPSLVIPQIRSIVGALQTADLGNQIAYETNSMPFLIEVINLHKKIIQILSGTKGRKFIDSHPVWGYFARTYGLQQVPVVSDRVNEFIEHAREDKIKLVVQSPFSDKKSLDLLAGKIGAVTILADPLAENWSKNLRQMAMEFKKALK